MYFNVDNEESNAILSVKELIGIVLVFGLMLYLLFPKGNIEELVKNERTNTNLSINYLESMLLYHPDNMDLKLLLITNYRYKGELDKAAALSNEMLHTVMDKTILTELYKQEYLILKERYFQWDGRTQQTFIMPQLQQKLQEYYEYTKGSRDYLFFFAESSQINYAPLKYRSLKGLMKQQPELIDYDLEKEAYYIASSLKYQQEAYEHLVSLLKYPQIDKELQESALMLLINHGEYEKAFAIAQRLFVKYQKSDEVMHLFNIALYALQQIPDAPHMQKKINALVELYKKSKILTSDDIYLLLHTLIQSGNIRASSLLATQMFKSHPHAFTAEVIELAIQTLQYTTDLDEAREIAYFAYGRYPSKTNLDIAIRLAQWTSQMHEAFLLIKQGYFTYHDKAYEKKILEAFNWDNDAELLGQIYRQKVAEGNFSAVASVADYFTYTGEIDNGEAYFLALLETHPHPEVHKQAILFSHYNEHYPETLKLYEAYQERYGENKEIQHLIVNAAIAIKEFFQAYRYAKENEIRDPQFDKPNQQLTDLAWLLKDYPFLRQKFWEYDQHNLLHPAYYYRLVLLDKAFSSEPKIVYLYEKGWKKGQTPDYLLALLYFYMDKKEYAKFEKVLKRIPPKVRFELEKSSSFKVLLAHYYATMRETNKAWRYLTTALRETPYDRALHEAYLWFLIDNRLDKPLVQEVKLLHKTPKLRHSIGFPAVVAALTVQRSDLALNWIVPILPLLREEKEKFEYRLLYVEILELQDRHTEAEKIRYTLYKEMKKQIKASPELLHDKQFVRIYLPMVARYLLPYEKKVRYLEQFKPLFSPEEFREIMVGWWYGDEQNADKVNYITEKYKMNQPWLQLYLALTQQDNTKKQKLLDHHAPTLPIRDKVTVSRDLGNIPDAYSFAFEGLENNQRDMPLQKIYTEMIASEYPNHSIGTQWKQLSSGTTSLQTQIETRWQLYKNIDASLQWEENRYKIKKRETRTEDILAVTLSRRDTDLSWQGSLAQHLGDQSFTELGVQLNYHHKPLTVGVEGNYNKRTQLTPVLQLDTLETNLKIGTQIALPPHDTLGISYQTTHYKKIDGKAVGNAKQWQLNHTHLFRSGYPDLQWRNSITLNRYDFFAKSTSAIRDFNELGTQLSFGTSAQNRLSHSWKPFGTFGLAINDQQNVGNTLSLGLTGMVHRQDRLNLIFNYTQGMGMINEASYGFHLEYRF